MRCSPACLEAKGGAPPTGRAVVLTGSTAQALRTQNPSLPAYSSLLPFSSPACLCAAPPLRCPFPHDLYVLCLLKAALALRVCMCVHKGRLPRHMHPHPTPTSRSHS